MTRFICVARAALFVSLALGAADRAGAAELTGSVTIALPDELLNTWKDRLDALEERVEALEAAQDPDPAPDPDPSPPPPVAGPGATGRFVAHADGRFYDPAGNPFAPRGVNLAPAAAGAAHRAAVQCWGFNFILLNAFLNEAGTGTTASNAQIDAFIDTYTAMGIVVMPDWHRTGGYMDGAGQRAAMLAFFQRLATKYRDNPYVWYGGYNEPGGIGTSGDTILVDGQWTWNPDRVTRWVGMSRAIVQAVRAAGATAPVSVPSMAIAQDILANATWNWGVGLARPLPERSASATFGGQVRQGLDNTFAEIHLYGNYDHPDRQAPLAEYFAHMQAAGWPVLVGEMGSINQNGDQFDSTLNRVALRAAYPHVGDVFWHGDHTGPNKLTIAPGTAEGIAQINDCNDPSNLTRAGKAIWDGTHPGTYPPGTY
jgi:mannan endo-1,4-beta-mannosidase